MPTLPTQNPFENLFGGEGAPAKTTPTKTNIPQNPFQGLFEAKTSTPTVQPTRELDQFGLPKATIRAAKPGEIVAEPEKKESFWTKAARVVLPKSLEDYFGVSKEKVAEKQKQKEFEQKYEEAYAYKDLERLQKKIEEGGGKLPKQTAADVMQETKVEKYLPFVSAIPDIVNSVQIYQSAKRLEKGEETMVDIYRLSKFRAEQERDKTFGAKVASVLTELPSFGGELLATGGIYTAGKAATEKAIVETLEKSLGKTVGRIATKSVANIVGGTLQTIPARAGEIAAGTVQNMIPEYSFTKNELGKLQPVISGEGDDLWSALAKSGANQWVEVVTEHSGGMLYEMTNPLKNQLLKVGVLKAFLKSNPTATSANFMKWVNRAGWNGVLGEMFEERVGELARGVLTEVGLSEDGWVIPSKEQLAVELVAFSVPGAMIETANRVLQSGGTIQEAMTAETEAQKTAPKPITMAENIIGARDILTVGKGGTDLNADIISNFQSQLDNYYNEMADTAIEVLDTDQSTLASIKVVPYPDGKWGYSYELNTADNGISSDFLSNRLTNTKAEAISNAKAEILMYAKKELGNVSDEVKAEFQDIISHIDKVNPQLGVPIEVRRKNVAETKAKIPTTKLSALDFMEVEKPVAKAVEATADEGAVSSGFHFSLNQLWTIVYKNPSNKIIDAAKKAGLEVSKREAPKGSGQILTDISLPDVGVEELDKAEKAFNNFADIYEGKEPTQKEKVSEAVKGKPKTIKEIAEETKILEPNVRRILGVGAKEGTFERVDKGVYILKKDGKQLAYVETGNAVEVLPRLAKEGMKADMVFLDIPYKTPSVTGGNRGAKFEFITVEQFGTVVEAVKTIARTEDTPIFYMFSQAPSGVKEMQKYTDQMTTAGFKAVARGEYTKLQKDGITRTRNMRGVPDYPEGIILFTKSGNFDKTDQNLNFKLIRPKGYQTEKPAELAKALIEMSTKEGEVVLDPFAGSGVVPAEAVKAGREAVAIEKSEKAVEEFIKPRIEEATKEKPAEKTPRFAKQKTEIMIGKKIVPAHEIAAKIIPKRPNLPILSEFMVKDGILTATDLEMGVRLNTDLKDGMYRIVGKDAVKTDTDPAEFPILPEVEGKPIFTALTETIADTLKQASLSIAEQSNARFELTGVLMKVENGTITVASTDAYRLYVKQMGGKILGTGDFILSNPEKVQKVITALGGKVDLIVDKDYVKFVGDNGEAVIKKVDGAFPEFKQIIPAFSQRLSLDKKKTINALKELKPYLKEIGYGATTNIKYKDGKITLSALKESEVKKEIVIDGFIPEKVDIKSGSLNDGVLVMPIRAEKEGLNVNADYLIDALNANEGDNAYLYYGERETPMFVSSKRDLKSEEIVPEKKKRAPSGIASSGASKIGTFEELAGIEDKTEPEMKLYEEVKGLVEKYAKSIGENYTPRNALGVYYPSTGNIRIKGMNDISVAAHEITHFLDFAYKISDQLQGIKGYAINGNPIYEANTAKLRKEMSAVYENLYPGGKATHKLSKRMIEGFATLLQKYAEQPSTMTAQYPNVVREFLTPEGKYYKPVMGDIIKDLRAMVSKYQGLPALDKVGSRVINDKVNVNKDTFLNFWQRFKTEIVDNVYPIEMLAKQSGTHFTKADPSLWVRQYTNSSAIILNNINGNKGYWGWRNGELVKLHDYNWKDLIKELHTNKITNEFGYWLVARREYFMFQDYSKEQDPEKKAELKKIIDADGFTEQEVSEAYLLNKDEYEPYAEKYDAMVKDDLDFLHDPTVGLVNNDEYKQLSEQEGYASFKRYFYDEIVGEEAKPMARVRFGTAKVSSMLKRTGSQKPIVNPLFSALTNHAEITRKGLKQTVANRIGEIAGNFPDLFQKAELKVIPDAQGRLIFPQEKDNSIIMARLNYKRVPFLTDAVIKRTIDEVLNSQNLSFFEKLLMGSSRFFTKGTTGLFPGFAITNYTVDQVTAAAQSRNKYKVLYDPLKKVFQMLNKDKPQHEYLQEYLIMGGERQTFVGWQDMTPNELFDALNNEKAGILKAVDYLNSGMNILAIPSQWSEIMTRATEYIKAREAGKTQIVSFEEAGRVTAPFHHIGRWGGGKTGQAYIKSIPFFNPAIQVLSQAAETLETPEGRQRYAFVALAITAASIGSLGLIMAYGSDDQKRLFADINPDELNKYIWLPNPDGKSLIKLRIPDQMAVIATLVNMLWANKSLQANYSAGEYLNAGMAWLPAQVDISQPTKMFMSWIPQLIKPGALTLAGVKDFPKIMPLESQGLQNRAPEYRYNEATSPVAKWLGKQFGLSPIKIDYLLTGYAGRATGFLTGKPGIYNPLKSMSREYYFTSGRKVQDFYDAKERNDQKYEAYKKGRTDYALGERTAILKERAKLKIIDSTLGLYRDIDEEKNPDKAKKMRDKILKMIDEL